MIVLVKLLPCTFSYAYIYYDFYWGTCITLYYFYYEIISNNTVTSLKTFFTALKSEPFGSNMQQIKKYIWWEHFYMYLTTKIQDTKYFDLLVLHFTILS